MKKYLFLILSLLFLFLFPTNSYALENLPDIDLGPNIEETVIDCSSTNINECEKIGVSRKIWSSMNDDYQYNNPSPVAPSGTLSFSKNQFVGPMPDGKNVLSDFIPEIMNYNYKTKSYFSYSGKQDNKYRAYMYFSGNGPLQTYTQIEGYDWVFNLLDTDGNSLLTDEYYVGYLNFEEDYVAGTNHYPYGLVLFFEFTSKRDFDEFRFYLSSEELVNIYMGNASSSTSVRLAYRGFKFVETNSFLLADDTDLPDDVKDMIDTIYDSSNSISQIPSIFDDLKQCDVTDIGCHFDNLWTVLKGIVQSITSFFTTIYDVIVTFFKNIFSSKIFGISALLEKLNDLLNFEDNGLTGVITSPLKYIKSLSNGTSTCSPIHLSLPSWFNHDLTLPCPTTFYSRFSALFTVYQTVTTGLIAYWCLVNILALTLQFKDPLSNKIEVMDL